MFLKKVKTQSNYSYIRWQQFNIVCTVVESVRFEEWKLNWYLWAK